VRATLMGSVFLSLFVGNLLVGWIGGFYDRMTPAAFWGTEMAVAVAGGLLATLLKSRLEAFFDAS
jgi:POT family proton-dependent oligopeptide transporter